MTDEDPIGDFISERFGRATLPITQDGSAGLAGTAFFYNELIESTPQGDRVREWLVTAGALTRSEYGEVTLRPDMIKPLGAASDLLLVADFHQQWAHDDGGSAVMTTTSLHDHARTKGWAWETRQLTDGFAATATQVHEYVEQAIGVYAIGHVVASPRERVKRPVALASASMVRGTDGQIRWRGTVPDGFVGAPVIAVRRLDNLAFGLHCVGLLLPGERDNPIATFDTIRNLIAKTVTTAAPSPSSRAPSAKQMWDRLRRRRGG